MVLPFLFYSRTLQPKFIKRLDAIKQQSFNRDDRQLMAQLEQENPLACGQARMLLCAVWMCV